MEKLAQYPAMPRLRVFSPQGVRDLANQSTGISYESEILSYYSAEQVLAEHAVNLLNYPHRDAQMKTRLPQREDVWSVKECYCIDRGYQPSKVEPASGQHYHRLHSGSKHVSHVCSELERLHTFWGSRDPSELATEKSRWAG